VETKKNVEREKKKKEICHFLMLLELTGLVTQSALQTNGSSRMMTHHPA